MFLYKVNVYSKLNNIFSDKSDYESFLEILERSIMKFRCLMHSFTLMPTHYYFLLETRQNQINEFINYINQSYSFNNFSHKFANKFTRNTFQTDINIIEKNFPAVRTSFFIHAIPYLSGITDDPVKYEWSSLPNFVNFKKKFNYIDPDYIFSQISNRFILSYHDYRKHFYHFINKSDFYFIESTDFRSGKDNLLSTIQYEDNSDYIEFKKISELTKKFFPENQLLKKKADIYLFHKYSGEKNKVIAQIFGISLSRVSQIIKNVLSCRQINDIFISKLKLIEKELRNINRLR